MRKSMTVAIGAILVIVAVAACTGGSGSLTGKTWQLTAVTEKVPAFQGVVPAEAQADYTITFGTDGNYTGIADCNSFAGSYTTSGSSITINPGPSTLMACAEDSFGPLYVHALTTATTYSIASDQLTLANADGGALTFAVAPNASAAPSAAESAAASASGGAAPADLTANPWQLAAVTEKVPAFQGVVPTDQQADYTIAFAADGTFSAKADCNMLAGTFTVGDSNALTIVPGPSTLAMCPEGSLGDLYVVGLGNAESYLIHEGQLVINLVDGGTLTFAPGA